MESWENGRGGVESFSSTRLELLTEFVDKQGWRIEADYRCIEVFIEGLHSTLRGAFRSLSGKSHLEEINLDFARVSHSEANSLVVI